MDFQEFFTEILNSLGGGVLSFLSALAFLIIAWIVALIGAAIVRGLFRRTNIDERVGKAISGEDGTEPIDISKWISRIVFYVILLFGIVGFLQRLNLEAVAGPLQSLLNSATAFIPSLLGAIAILVIAWVIARILKFLIIRIANSTNLDERLTKSADLGDDDVSISETLGTAAYWIIFLLFLPAFLSQLGMEGLVAPVQNMIDGILSSLPQAFAALLIFLVGWFVARIVRQIVTNLLKVAGADKLGERIGMSDSLSLSGLAGTVVYALIILTTLIAALGELNIESISGPLTGMLSTALEAIPGILGAAIILGLAYVVARLVSQLIASILEGIGFNKLPGMLGFKMSEEEGRRSPSDLAGILILVIIMLFAATEAANVLGFTLLAAMVANFTAFGGQILLAVVILGIGIYLGNLAHSVVLGAGGNQATFTATLARTAVVVFAGALALQQLGIAEEIVNLAFGILLGAIGVAAALAFGLGSREVAGREVEKWVEKMRAPEDN